MGQIATHHAMTASWRRRARQGCPDRFNAITAGHGDDVPARQSLELDGERRTNVPSNQRLEVATV